MAQVDSGRRLHDGPRLRGHTRYVEHHCIWPALESSARSVLGEARATKRHAGLNPRLVNMGTAVAVCAPITAAVQRADLATAKRCATSDRYTPRRRNSLTVSAAGKY